MRPVFSLLFDEFEELAWPRDCRVLQLTSDIQEISIAVEKELGIRVVRHFQEIIVPLSSRSCTDSFPDRDTTESIPRRLAR